jgi:phage terminase small subunit
MAKNKKRDAAAKIDFSDCAAFQKLRTRVQSFVLYYLNSFDGKTFNGALAARQAGYAAHTARITAAQLLQKPNVKSAVSELKAKIFDSPQIKAATEKIASAQEVAEYLTQVLRGDIGQVAEWNDGGLSFNSTSEGMPEESRRLIKKITVKEKTSPKGDFTEVQTAVELHDPVRAAELLGKYHKMFIEKVDMNLSGEITLKVKGKK